MTKKILCIFLAVVMFIELGVAGFKYPGFLKKGDDTSKIEEASDSTGNNSARKGSSGSIMDDLEVVQREKDTMPKEGGEITLCGVTVASTSDNLSADEEVEVIDCGVSKETSGDSHFYNISMGEHRQFEVPVEVSFPIELEKDEDVSVIHHLEDEDVWMPMAAEYNEDDKTVTAYFSSFSDIEVRKEKKNLHDKLYYVSYGENEEGNRSSRNATLEISSFYWSILENLDSKNLSDEAIRFVADPSLYAQDFEKYRDSFSRDEAAALDASSMAFTVLSPIMDITSQIPASMQNFMFDYAEPVGNALGWVTLIMATHQTLRDFEAAGGDFNAIPAPAANAYKNLFSGSGTLYSFVTGYGSIGFSVAFVGVTLVAFTLDYTVEEAKAAMSKRTADVFDAYFEKVEPFDKNEWYRLFKEAYYQSNNNPNKAMEIIQAKMDETVEGFWSATEDENNLDILIAATEADTKNYFTQNNLYFNSVTQEEKSALNSQMKQRLWVKFKKETMPLVNRFLKERMQEGIYSKLSVYTEPFNRYMNFEILETVPDMMDDAEAVARFAGCTIAFGKEGKPVDGWEVIEIPEDMTDGWQTEYDCTVMGYLEAGCPDSLLVYETKSACTNGGTPLYTRNISPDITGNNTNVIDLTKYAEENQEEEAVLDDEWYLGTWCVSDIGSGNAIRLTAVGDDNSIGVDHFLMSSVKDGSTMKKHRGTYMAELTIDDSGEYVIIGQSAPNSEGKYFSAIKIFKPQGDSTSVKVILAPREVTGDSGTEGHSTYYRRELGGEG